MKKAFCIVLGLFCKIAFATDLMDIYLQALENDPIFKQAYNSYMSIAQSIPEARAALLPQMTLTSRVGRSYQLVSAGLFSVVQTYNNSQWQLNASQAIFNYQAWAALLQASAATKSAYAGFNDAAQNLMLRTARAYFAVLFTQDTLNFVKAKLRANKRQLEQAEERFNVGLEAITAVYEAKAAYDQSRAEVISASNNQVNQNENLRKLTNHVYEHLAPLRDSKIPLIKPEPYDVNEWISIGLKQNYNLLSAKFSLQAARDNIKVQSSGNWPSFAVVANNTENHNDSGPSVFVPSSQKSAYVALAMTFPAFQGGLVEAQTKQAQFDFQSSSEKLEALYRDVVVNTHISFNTIIAGISKITADRVTIVSQRNSLESVEAQFQAGTRTMTDVVIAQQRLFEAQEQLASDQYQLIASILNLKYLAGTLNVNDLEEINAWLNTTRVNGLPPKKTPPPLHSSRK